MITNSRSTSQAKKQASPKLSLLSAILINLNIMIGSGIFVNTVLLASLAGVWGAAVYVAVGMLILPLILTFSHLMGHHKDGGTFYEFGADLAPAWGFCASWSYFVGKLASSALGIHVFVTLVQALLQPAWPIFATTSPLFIDGVIIGGFTLLNMFNVSTGSKVNYLFVAFKSIPILFIVVSAICLFNFDALTYSTLSLDAFTSCIPFVLFSFTGFEASCSLSQSIENPQKNGPKAILISFFITITTVLLYQMGFFTLLGEQLGHLRNYSHAFAKVVPKVIPTAGTWQKLWTIMTFSGIAASSLGASYAIMYSNVWNLYRLAEKKLLPGYQVIGKKNSYNTPFIAVLITGLIVTGYTLFSSGNQIPLQQIGACGATIAYSISVLAFAKATFSQNSKQRVLALLSIISCMVFIHALIRSARTFGPHPLLLLTALILAGMALFYGRKK